MRLRLWVCLRKRLWCNGVQIGRCWDWRGRDRDDNSSGFERAATFLIQPKSLGLGLRYLIRVDAIAIWRLMPTPRNQR